MPALRWISQTLTALVALLPVATTAAESVAAESIAPTGAAGNSTTLVAAVLPGSRSVTVGAPATAFATLINAGSTAGAGCRIAQRTVVPATFTFQTTDPATNVVTGTPHTSVALAAGAAQSFVLSLQPTAEFPPTDIDFDFFCDNAPAATSVTGVNTFLLGATTTAVADVVALAASASPGVLDLADAGGNLAAGAFAVATSNVGAAGELTVSADTGATPLPLELSLCQTNPATGACNDPPAITLTLTMAAGATATFGVFATPSAPIAFAPGANRIFLRLRDTDGVVRGATSVAVRGGTAPVDNRIDLPLTVHVLTSGISQVNSTFTNAAVSALVDRANAVWAPADIHWSLIAIQREPIEREGEVATAIAGGGVAQTLLLDMLPRDRLNSVGWDVYVVRDLTAIAGFPGVFFPSAPAIISTEVDPAGLNDPGRILAHELGHALTLQHTACTAQGNLMAPGCSSADRVRLTQAQIDAARAQAQLGVPTRGGF